MSAGRVFLHLGGGLVDRALCILGAVGFSQAPEFMQQYLQRLGGHLAEAQRQLSAFRRAAEEAGVTLDGLITQTAMVPDPAVARLSGVMTDSLERVTILQSAHDALAQASAWERPFVFLRHLDPTIAHATAAAYQPAVPTTLEGLAYAFAGMVCLLLLYYSLLALLSRLWRRRQIYKVASAT